MEINELLNEKKEMEFTIKEIKKENKELKEKKPLDYTKWKEWNCDQIFRFIMNIFDDNRLNEYKNDIYREIFESEYTGEDLQGLEIGDIKSMGIKKIKIRKDVFKAIKKLTQNNINKQYNDE